jgi:NAD(P)-dependent dehydrogenase (short-subunit alcohol dehydrogenase family)
VYITGRRARPLADAAALVRSAAPGGGGRCTPIVCDHADDAAVAACFAQVAAASEAAGGRLDLLVNSAFAGADVLAGTMGVPFWDKRLPGGDGGEAPGAYWDCINGVGLRSNYVATVHAARLMVPGGGGLIVNISSWGGTVSIFDAVYGAGKAANDRLMRELAANLAAPVDTGVRAFTLYPGLVSTELIADGISAAETDPDPSPDARSLLAMAWNAESPLYVGRVIAAIAADPCPRAAARRQGNIVIAAEAAARYGVVDVGGEVRFSGRSLKSIVLGALPALRASPAARLVPDWLVPWPLVTLATAAGPSVVR